MNDKTIKRNYLLNTIYQVFSIVLPVVTMPYESRKFSAYGVGIRSYTTSVMTIFMLLAALGCSAYGEREIARKRKNRREYSRAFWEIEITNLLLTAIMVVIYILYIAIFGGSLKAYYGVLTIALIGNAFQISWFYTAFEEFDLVIIKNTAVRLIDAVLLFVIVKNSKGLLPYMVAVAVVGLFGNLFLWISLKKYLVRVKISDIYIGVHIRKSLSYFIPVVATTLYTIIDKAMIGGISKSKYENGYYEQASGFIKMILALVTSMNTVMSARMSLLFEEGKLEEIKKKLHDSLNTTLSITIPLMVMIIGVARLFIPKFLGPGYLPVVNLVYVFAFILFPMALSNALSLQCLNPAGRARESSRIVIMSAVINAALNAILIYFFKSMGAAIASVISESFIAVVYMKKCSDFISWKNIIDFSGKKIKAAVGMLAAMILVGIPFRSSNIIAAILQLIAGIMVYVFLMLKMEDEFVMNMVKKVKKQLKKF